MAFLQAQGNIEPGEMARTFNCGIGMVLIVDPAAADTVEQSLAQAGETVYRIGALAEGERGCTVFGQAGTWFAREAWSAAFHG